MEVKSIEDPELERGKDGKLIVRAIITASDANERGSAASSYDPASNTGIIFTKRVKSETQLTLSFWQTGVMP